MSDKIDQVAFFEDSDSIAAKTAYVKSNYLGGLSVFSIEMDDFTGIFCMQGKFPLINSIRETFDQ